eukprot:2100166-Prymnesium_polylepis.1
MRKTCESCNGRARSRRAKPTRIHKHGHVARHWRANERARVVIHDLVPHLEKRLGRQGLGDKIRFVVGARDEGDDDLQ